MNKVVSQLKKIIAVKSERLKDIASRHVNET